jgi:DNA-binding MarR family transcriptional regulator
MPLSDQSFLERALDLVDPHGEPWDAGLRAIQRICGRWLAMRRIRRNLTLHALAEHLGIDVHTVRRLEEGMGVHGSEAVPQRVWTRLAARLVFEGAEHDRIVRIIQHALGHVVPPERTLIDQLIHELPSIDEVTSPAAEPVVVAAPEVASPPQLSAEQFDLLELVLAAPRHSIFLADTLKKDSPTINGLLVKMQAEQWIEKEGQQIDPDIDADIELTYYRATARGQQVYVAERDARERAGRQVSGVLPQSNVRPSG